MKLDSISAVHLHTNHSFRSSEAMLLSSTERAAFATTARLLSCLVTESLVPAIFISLPWSDGVGFAVVLNPPISNITALDSKSYSEGDILAIVPLRHIPLLRTDSIDPRWKQIGLLDPLDMFPRVFVTSQDSDIDQHWEVWPSNPVQLHSCSTILCV
jgi:hypothetical protein